MRYSQSEKIVAVLVFVATAACLTTQAQKQTPASPYSGMGSAPTREDMGNLAWTAGPSGRDLPPVSGTSKEGMEIFLGKCSKCHGINAEGVHWRPGAFSPIHGPRLGGGNIAPVFNRPPGRVTTIAYAAPWPQVIFNTIAVEMPMFQPGTLTADQVYAITAFLLFKNGLLKEDDVMNRETLPKVQMPDRNSIPASDDVYMDMNKRGCYKTHGVCLGD